MFSKDSGRNVVMDGYEDSVMIALLPVRSEWCKNELPHLTLAFCGELKDLKESDFNAMAKDAATIASLSRGIVLETMGLEVMGKEDKVNVVRLRPSQELLAMRYVVERWDKSEFPFNPHVTIGPASDLPPIVPSRIVFSHVVLSWGNENLPFRFNN